MEIIQAIIRRLFKVYLIQSIAQLFSAIIISLLYLISPISRIKVGLFTTSRIGHLALDVDTFNRKRQCGYSTGVRHIFIAGNPCNAQLLKMWKRYHFIIQSEFLHMLFNHAKWLYKKTPFYEPLDMNSNEYQLFQQGHPTLRFTQEEEDKGKLFLNKMGIQTRDWFVCIFARDDSYLNKVYKLNQWSYHDYRNADITHYIPAIKYILDIGGYVIRIGYYVNKPVNFCHQRFIDYAINCRDDFLDIYLVAKCKFLLGTTSGICDVANIFDTPRIGVNWAPIGAAPFGKYSLYIPKKLKDRNSGRHISFEEYFRITENRMDHPLLWDGNKLYEAGYEYEENTADEILDVTKEMISYLEGTWNPSIEDCQLLDKYFQNFPKGHWSCNVKTPIGLNFLKQNKQLFIKET